ncbi:transglycosylase domain-containing protein [Mariluticola halotolerans]|uniref:transglycosylase domain-containing protein n=1 Tax=Mariluticola halotolerans TaxID=2909283 RepID=UPI0026E3574A|nr:PBP1A family penicillin-binding protein [Mariluticola halotolerans]UJQ93452.1 PBP1A family penicillin-binding protein [Mariluticola halotolerans]
MDLKLSPEDRVGGTGGKKKGRTTKTTRTRAKKPVKGRTSRSKRTKPKLTFGRVLGKLFYWGVVAAVWGGIAVTGIVIYYAMQLPAADTWAVPERPANIRIVAADGQLISNRGKMGGEAVSFRELPQYVPAAVISIEDKRFMSHPGVDPIGILAALVDNITEGRIARGGSTLTQQLAKNLFLTPDQNIGRKIQEALLSIWLEQNYSKDQILELYLNRVYFGAGAYGIEAASQTYFAKSARNLSLGEAAILAGLLQAPSRLSPDRHPEAAAARARVVLNEMADEGYISEAEAAAAAIDPNKRIRTRVAGAEYYVADWVETLMDAYIGSVDEDVIVYTTIDWDLQKQGEFFVREMVRENGPDHNFSQGALVAMEPDGAVRAIVGGTDYAKSQYNRAVTARRQPGSSFKPFVYLSALEHGLTPDSIVEDAPFEYKGWKPQNYSNKYVGRVTLRDALANSLNTVAGRLAIEMGPESVVNTAMRLGISSPLQAVPSIALGSQEVSLLELTAAFAPFANGGNGVIAHVITRIETADGQQLYQNIPAGPGRVIAPENVAMMNDMLSYAVEVGTAKKAHVGNWPIAGKTGTTQDNRDAVFVGFSARMVTGVWLGNDDDSPMKGVGGGGFPVAIWSEFMEKAHQGLAVAALPGGDYTRFANAAPAAPDNAGTPSGTEKPRTLVDLFSGLFGN